MPGTCRTTSWSLTAKNGGIVMVNIFPGFVNQGVLPNRRQGSSTRSGEFAAKYPDDPKRASTEYLDWLAQMMTQMEPGTLAEVADHIDHIVKVAGIDHVGYGADFGSLTNHPKGLEDVSRYPPSHGGAPPARLHRRAGQEDHRR